MMTAPDSGDRAIGESAAMGCAALAVVIVGSGVVVLLMFAVAAVASVLGYHDLARAIWGGR